MKIIKNKNFKKTLILLIIGIILLLVGFLSWNLYFSKYKIFKEEETAFEEAVIRYYSFNTQQLPKKGETRELTLQDMYEGGHLADLKVPKSNKLCDTSSWVRVYQNDEEEYIYTTYLKCGKFESNVDHTGPEIKLNGSTNQTIVINGSYEELGVESVTDDVDGKLNNSDVVIDSSKVDTSKIGTYEVTYTIRDKAYNKTVVTRIVTVAYSLTNEIRNKTSQDGYYKGNTLTNYLQYAGMLWRIVNVNEDGSIQIISDDPLSNLRADYTSYIDSDIDKWLTEDFYKSLNESSKKYLVESSYCIGDTTTTNDLSSVCSTVNTSNVGILSLSDYYKTFENNNSYLCTNNVYLLGGTLNSTNVINNCASNNLVSNLNSGLLPSIRATVTLRNNLFYLEGTGTNLDPYKLDDYSYGKNNSNLNERLVGEFFEYSGISFRIMAYDGDNVKAIMTEPWTNNSTGETLKLSTKTSNYDISDENSYLYLLNEEYIDYINSNAIINHDSKIPVNVAGTSYSDFELRTVKAKVTLPRTYDLFSPASTTPSSRNQIYLYSDLSSNEDMIYMVNGANGAGFEVNAADFSSYAIRAVVYLNGNLKISGGNGTINSPYLVK